MKVIYIIMFCFPIICSCQNDSGKYKIALPPKVTSHQRFQSVEDSLNFTVFVKNLDSFLITKEKHETAIINKLGLLNGNTKLNISNHQVIIFINKLFLLNRIKATEICFLNFKITSGTDRPVEEDILMFYPFLSVASNHLNPYEIINAIIKLNEVNKCLSERDRVRNSNLFALTISNSFSLTYGTIDFHQEKKHLLDYIEYLLKTLDANDACLTENLLALNNSINNHLKID